MYFIIQENVFRDHHYHMLTKFMDRYQLGYQVVKVLPFVDEIEHDKDAVPPDEEIFVFGSVKLARIANRFGWKPGSFYNSNHDYRVYSNGFGLDNMLNGDSIICGFGDEFEVPKGSSLFFARPCEDTKSFTGQVFMRESWDSFVKWNLDGGFVTSLTRDTPVQICTIKDIQREIRTWIVRGHVVTASQYRINERTVYQECKEQRILDFAQSMADVYQPAEMFVLDIAVLPDDVLKIVEVNCINCAGFYEADLSKLLQAVVG